MTKEQQEEMDRIEPVYIKLWKKELRYKELCAIEAEELKQEV